MNGAMSVRVVVVVVVVTLLRIYLGINCAVMINLFYVH